MYIHLNVYKLITDFKLLMLHSNGWKLFNVCIKRYQQSQMKTVDWPTYHVNLYLYENGLMLNNYDML